MKRIKSLKSNNHIYLDPVEIDDILRKNGLVWMVQAEIENAIIEIRNGKVYWIQGIWYYGDWDYGIWLDGIFRYGNWKGGVWYNGVWKNGVWENGVWMNGKFESGQFLSGDFRKGEKNETIGGTESL